jgi:hypothetical protein
LGVELDRDAEICSLLEANKEYHMRLNVKRSIKEAVRTQNAALLGEILGLDRVGRNQECRWRIIKTANEFLTKLWNADTTKRFEESDSPLRDIDEQIRRLKRQREVLLEGRVVMKRKLDEGV